MSGMSISTQELADCIVANIEELIRLKHFQKSINSAETYIDHIIKSYSAFRSELNEVIARKENELRVWITSQSPDHHNVQCFIKGHEIECGSLQVLCLENLLEYIKMYHHVEVDSEDPMNEKRKQIINEISCIFRGVVHKDSRQKLLAMQCFEILSSESWIH